MSIANNKNHNSKCIEDIVASLVDLDSNIGDYVHPDLVLSLAKALYDFNWIDEDTYDSLIYEAVGFYEG